MVFKLVTLEKWDATIQLYYLSLKPQILIARPRLDTRKDFSKLISLEVLFPFTIHAMPSMSEEIFTSSANSSAAHIPNV